ncbi:MAG TPA: DUF885 domain-containing protein [Terriglobales bacterium]|nr:DUF885 domain-containing protein [Terriglobales bacterium]
MQRGTMKVRWGFGVTQQWLVRVFALMAIIALGNARSTAQAPLASGQTSSPELAKFFSEYFEETLRDSPEYATSIGRHEYDDRWSDLSKEGRARRRSHLEQALAKADAFSKGQLSKGDQLSINLLRYDLRTQLDAYDLQTYLIRVGQLFGFHNSVYTIVDRMPAFTVKDCENIIARLHAIPLYVDQNIEILNEAIAHQMTQPKIVSDLVIGQLTTQVGQDADKTALLFFLKKMPPSIPAAERERLRKEATAAFENDFRPAWRKALNYMQTTYAAHVRPTVGISGLPNGREDYQILIRRLTTTNETPEEIHKIGLAEVDRIEGEMLAIAKQTGFQGTVSELELKLANDPEQKFHSKDEMLIYCRNAAKIIEPDLPNQFKHIPLLLYGVRAIPEDREAATASNAQAPSPDGSTPGWFNLQAYQPEKQVKYDKEALVLHEAVPGHIFQISLAHSLPGLPDFRKFYNNSAYAEGWALYAESLGSELGMYKDPYNKFGELASERFRAARLVIDTGIHAMGWTREQAQDYLKAHAPTENLAEIDRYISWPAQALAYKTGQLEIIKLRRQAESQLGPKFDVRDFHDAVLRNGALPMELLDVEVGKYLGGKPAVGVSGR